MWSVDDKGVITLTRGDSFAAEFPYFLNDSEEPYELQEGDKVRFAAKADWDDMAPVINKAMDGYVLKLEPQDTKLLEFGGYWYDVEITFANGDVLTYIAKKRLILDKEVH